MTIEEKATDYCDEMMCTICSNIRCGYNGKCAEWETRKSYYLAGAKENGVIWHDLRKDRRDLPKENMEVITVGKTPKGALRKKVAFYFKNTKLFCLWNKEYNCYTQLRNIIAWHEEPQFKGEEK